MYLTRINIWVCYKRKNGLDLVPQSWIIDCLKMYKISDEVKKMYYEYLAKLESGINSKRKKFNCGENTKRYFPGRYAIAIIICNSENASQSHS